MTFLREQTELEKIGEGIYERVAGENWFGAAGLFGGYVNGLILRAFMDEVNEPERRPLSLNIHFVRPFPVGRMRIEVETQRKGSSVSFLTSRIFVEDKLAGLALGSFGMSREADEFVSVEPPPVSPFDPDKPKFDKHKALKCLENFEIWTEKPSRPVSELIGWIRSSHHEDEPDELFMLGASDAFPPVVFQRLEGSSPHFGGTMDFTGHFRRPATAGNAPGGLMICKVRTSAAIDGYVDEDCELFSPEGELLFQSRQLRFVQRLSEEDRHKYQGMSD